PNDLPIYFFFSSSRRNTSFSRDWSSDVCSSDLGARIRHARRSNLTTRHPLGPTGVPLEAVGGVDVALRIAEAARALANETGRREIGRASCRERGGSELEEGLVLGVVVSETR